MGADVVHGSFPFPAASQHVKYRCCKCRTNGTNRPFFKKLPSIFDFRYRTRGIKRAQAVVLPPVQMNADISTPACALFFSRALSTKVVLLPLVLPPPFLLPLLPTATLFAPGPSYRSSEAIQPYVHPLSNALPSQLFVPVSLVSWAVLPSSRFLFHPSPLGCWRSSRSTSAAAPRAAVAAASVLALPHFPVFRCSRCSRC